MSSEDMSWNKAHELNRPLLMSLINEFINILIYLITVRTNNSRIKAEACGHVL